MIVIVLESGVKYWLATGLWFPPLINLTVGPRYSNDKLTLWKWFHNSDYLFSFFMIYLNKYTFPHYTISYFAEIVSIEIAYDVDNQCIFHIKWKIFQEGYSTGQMTW